MVKVLTPLEGATITAHLDYMTTFNCSDQMLVTRVQLTSDEETLNSIDMIEVTTANQVLLFRANSRMLRFIDTVLTLDPWVIPVAAYWRKLGTGDGMISAIYAGYNQPMLVRLVNNSIDSRTAVNKKVATVNTIGYQLPRDKHDMPDARWFVNWLEDVVYTPARYYAFSSGGIIMRVIVDGITTPAQPYMTLGPGIPILIEPTELEPGAWCFDFTTGAAIITTTPGRAPMTILDSYETSNILLHVPQQKEVVKVCTQRVWMVQPSVSNWR